MIPDSIKTHTHRKVSAGRDDPLGAVVREGGVNFALFSKYAAEVFLLLFEVPDGDPTDIIKLEHKSASSVWHVFVHGLKPGQLYGYKVRGDYAPGMGMRFNANKLLIDPYARAVTGKARNLAGLLSGYEPGALAQDLQPDMRDNSAIVPKCIVTDDDFDWQRDMRPNIPLEELVIYETHLKGFTAHPSSGVSQPGTYLGFIEKIPHLKDLGINAVEFLPVHEFHVQDFLLSNGLTDYWGYNTIGFFAPESAYSSGAYPGCQVSEFKTLVRELHKAGIEVILDVVYNHTGEGSELGPTLCFRGIDNRSYYSLKGPDREPYRFYLNDTGCGNTVNVEHPAVLRLVMDSLRYWAEVMHVDGFRFDLASVLGRVKGRFSPDADFFEAVNKDPVLRYVKIIAEPWDLTTYQAGNFPRRWSEWNGKYRDAMRRFLRGDPGQHREFATRVCGSPDLYGDDGRSPAASVNFITCHDGFTLHDLFAYGRKRNEANMENNRDGSDDNLSWNCGAEGEVRDAPVNALRVRMAKNAFCCLFFSLGTPMMLGGDEFLRTQKGNNNAYCQDNPTSWLDWGLASRNAEVLEFCKKAIAFRKGHPVFGRRKFLCAQQTDREGAASVAWFDENLKTPNWDHSAGRILCLRIEDAESAAGPAVKETLFFIFNQTSENREVRLPSSGQGRWHLAADTHLAAGKDFRAPGDESPLARQDSLKIAGHSIAVLVAK